MPRQLEDKMRFLNSLELTCEVESTDVWYLSHGRVLASM